MVLTIITITFFSFLVTVYVAISVESYVTYSNIDFVKLILLLICCSPFLTRFTSFQNNFLLPSKSFPNRSPHRRSAILLQLGLEMVGFEGGDGKGC